MAADPRSDEGLMLAYRDGDAAAFDLLYARHRSRLYRYLVHQCGNAGVADELYQDIWLRVVDARTGYVASAKFTTWLFRIAHHRLIDHYRRHARDQARLWESGDGTVDDFPAPAEATPPRQVERLQIRERLAAALAELPAPQREAFLLAEEGGMSVDDIAHATGTGRETAKSRLRYALGKLRHALKDLL